MMKLKQYRVKMNNELNITLTTELRRLNDVQFEELHERVIWSKQLRSRINQYKLTDEDIVQALKLGDKRQVKDILRCGLRLTDEQINIIQNLTYIFKNA